MARHHVGALVTGQRRATILGAFTELLFALAAVALIAPVFPLGPWFGWAVLAASALTALTMTARILFSSALVPLWMSIAGLACVGIITTVVACRSTPGSDGLGLSAMELLQQGADQIVNEVIPVTAGAGLTTVLVIATCLVLVLVQMISTDVHLPATTGTLAVILLLPGIAFDQVAAAGAITAAAIAYVLLLLTHATPPVRRHGTGIRQSGVGRSGAAIASVLAVALALGAPTFAAASRWWATTPSIMSMFKPGVQGQVANILDVGVPNRDRSRALVGTVTTSDGSSPGVVRSYTTADFSGRTWTAPSGTDELGGYAVAQAHQSVDPTTFPDQVTQMTFDLPAASRTFAPLPDQMLLDIVGLDYPWQYSPSWGILLRPSSRAEPMHYEAVVPKNAPTAEELRATAAYVQQQPDGTSAKATLTIVDNDTDVKYHVTAIWNADQGAWLASSITPLPPTDDAIKKARFDSTLEHALLEIGEPEATTTVYADEYTRLPATLDPSVTELAKEIVAGADTDYDKALALQNYLRGNGFIYDRSIATVPNDQDPIATFLKTKRGYCIQYATTMIMMARAVGLPARLGVGYLVNERTGDNSWRIGAENAHAWPEIAFGDLGWIRFEPTPASQTGAAPAWAPDVSTTSSASPSAEATPSATKASTAPEASAAPSAQADGSGQSTDGAAWWPWGLAAIIVVAAALVVALLRRRAVAVTAVPPAERAWRTVGKAARTHGWAWRPTETPRRLVDMTAVQLPPEGAVALTRIGDALEAERYRPHPPPPDMDALAKDAATVAAAIAAQPRAHRRTARRLRLSRLFRRRPKP